MQKQTNKHTPFSKPFWKLLGISLATFVVAYGGIVWATVAINADCEVKDGIYVLDYVCSRLNAAGEFKTIHVTIPTVRSDVKIEGYSASEEGKQLTITNNGNDDIFVPVRTATELNAFLGSDYLSQTVIKNEEVCNPITTYSCTGSYDSAGSYYKQSPFSDNELQL